MANKRNVIAFAVFFVVCFLVYTMSFYKNSVRNMKISELLIEAEKSIVHSKAVSPKPRTLNLTNPLILLWTPYFSGDWVKKGFTVDCLRDKCLATSERVYLQFASVVLFHWRDVSATDLPSMKSFGQKWVLYNMESPANTYYVRSTMETLQNEIDWTMSYRLDSDIYAPYGQVIETNAINYKIIPLRTKKRKIAWFVSNCYTAGKREEYVKQLSNYVQVDIYGNCGKKKCPRQDDRKCLEMVANNYVFYLSFENSICKDYATEKLFRIMDYSIIPIVFGGANYSKILPPNSFIDALSYKSPQELSLHLKRVLSNETLYQSYFEWKRTHRVIRTIDSCLCLLCDKFLESKNVRSERLNRDLVKWWFDDAQCTPWKKSK